MDLDPRFTRHVKDRYGHSLEELFGAGELVESLLAHPGWDVLQALVGDEREAISEALDRQAEPLAQARYAQEHGRRDGLAGMRRAAEAVVGTSQAKLAEQRAKHEGGAESSPEGS